MSLAKIYHQAKAQQAPQRDEVERLRKLAVASTAAVTDSMIDSVNAGVAAVFANQRALDTEARTLQQQTARFSRQTHMWVTVAEQYNRAMKELGDIENWARVMEQDLLAITTALEAIHSPSV
eukprot:m51a1_g13364 putative biogenesis of lysosome-related organelles complex 1 subunit 1 (122) ;mRNA; f:1547-2049